MRFTFLLGISALAVLSACSDYNKVLKSDDYARKFAMANELYENESYERSINLYQQVYQRSPHSGEGEVSYYRVGKAYYFIEDYYAAGQESEFYTTSPIACGYDFTQC